MASLFVTGTGTGVGKTFVTAALIRHFRANGQAVDAIKPVASGFDPADATSDTALLLEALDRQPTPDELARVSPWRFAAPLSPDLAAKAEGRAVDFRALVDRCRDTAVATRGLLLIEGVGGIMVPLDETHTVLDWMSALRVPVLLVVGSYLGTISHTLTGLHVLAQRNLDIAGVVVSESETPGATLDATVATITRFAKPLEVIGLPRLAPGTAEHSAVGRLAALL
ncbi:MAG: dethiobiotin synthase [Xanthobacteraceae bacterium]